ncbi:helix-turn-helix transcriptional regulator [Arabiibacter massiliensis]|uniref:helix-turn-helix transcriptional regulator n=1 Tax=Arabiibacter massiliensis TaxID=1870985 RepID=UPI00117AE00B|nr:helix-turn-helix transcriptional regulator [Arabiibacter massiliensis]
MKRVREAGSAQGGAVLACVVALAIMGCAGGILNASLYARVAAYCGIAREISTLTGGALFLVIFLAATRKPALLDRRLLTMAALGCAVTAAFVLEFGLGSQNGPLTVAGFLFSNAASVWSSVLIVCALASLPSSKAALAAVVCGMALGEVVRVLHPPVGFEVGVVEVMAFYAVIIALLYRRGGAKLDEVARSASPASLELSNPESFLRPAHALFLCVALFSVATGYGLTLNEVSHAPISVDVSAVVLVGVAAWMLLSKSAEKEDQLFSFSVLLVVAGFIIAPFTFLNDLPSANALLRIGVRCFDMLVWLVVLAVGRRNLLALLPTYALVRFMSAVGTDVGAVAGHTTNDIVGTNGDAAMLIAEVVLFAFVAFLWLGFRRFSFSETIRGVVGMGAPTPREEAPAAEPAVEPGSSIEERCARLGEEHGLTERETEIFAMLARGRNGQFVMEHYVVSRNTVKSHVKHIYAKLDVHSQQELIDLVEHAE